MSFYAVKLFDVENVKKIRVKDYEWEVLLADKHILYEIICDLLLSKENMFYYVTQKESTKTLMETREYVDILIEKKIIDNNIEEIMQCIGWSEDKLNINSTIFQGDLAEYLMCIFVDQITNIDTIISKTSLKTSPGMPSFGNDNIFYDYENDILYYGEAKFYNDIDSALTRAQSSIEKHSGNLEFSFIKTHTNTFIAENDQKRKKVVEKFETRNIEEITVKSVSFIVNDDIHERKDYEQSIIDKFQNVENIIAEEKIMIFLPILSKSEFLEYFKKRLKEIE